MAFIEIPIYFSEDEAEEKENLGIPVKKTLGDITINTTYLLAFNGTQENTVFVRMSNGEGYECAMTRDEFEELIEKVEGVFRLTAMGTN